MCERTESNSKNESESEGVFVSESVSDRAQARASERVRERKAKRILWTRKQNAKIRTGSANFHCSSLKKDGVCV